MLSGSLGQALRRPLIPSQIFTQIDDKPYNGSHVPGDSPVKYHNDPTSDLFRIESLDMYPNPCVIESYCTVLIRGEFTTSLRNTTPHVSFNVTSHLPKGRTGLIPGEDSLCNWVDIVQQGNSNGRREDKRSCPPVSGKAHISSTILLLGGYVPAVNYTIRVKATGEGREGEEGRTIFDLWTEFELKTKDERALGFLSG